MERMEPGRGVNRAQVSLLKLFFFRIAFNIDIDDRRLDFGRIFRFTRSILMLNSSVYSFDMSTFNMCTSWLSEEESMVGRYESGYKQRGGDETTSSRHGRCGEKVQRYDIKTQRLNETNLFSCCCSTQS